MEFLIGMYFWVCSFNMLQGALTRINNAGYGDNIITIFTVPCYALIGFHGWTLEDLLAGNISAWIVTDFKANKYEKTLASRPDTLDGYTPKNQKLKTYPYMYIGCNPPVGTNKIFRYEDFSSSIPTFNCYCELSQNPSLCLVPKNYKGGNVDTLSETVTINGYPTLGWVTDYFNTWLAQNSNIISLNMEQEQFNYGVSQAQDIIGNVAQFTGQALTLNAGGALKTGVDSIFNPLVQDVNHEYYIKNQMAQVEKQSLLPNNASLSGNNSTLLGYGLYNNIFTYYTIKKQFAEKIDKFFDMYGYLTNLTKIPNLNNRPNWNYIKTVGCNITADIPQSDLEQIKNLFNNGLTLWHNPATFLDYSQNNR